MAEGAATTVLLNRCFTPLVEEEVQLLTGIRKEVEYIKDELERIRAFLRVADAAEEGDDELKLWVEQVRDVAHDIEDIINEFMLRFAHHYRNGFYPFLCKIASSIRNLKARRRIASALQDIKFRVDKISVGHQRYHYSYRSKILEQGSTSIASSSRWRDTRDDDHELLREVEPVGIENHKMKLTQWLQSNDSKLKVFPLIGMGGVGKTTLVKKVYDDPEIKKIFTNHAWITVTQSFKREELLKDMIQQLFGEMKQPILPEIETMNSHSLVNKIHDFLQQSKYVLVFDDVWSTDILKDIQSALPNNNYGSRVMLTTRNAEVPSAFALESRGDPYTTLEPLSEKDSWSLFSKKTFLKGCPPHLEEITRKILRKCQGLPLAIVAISGVLATKDTSNIDEWEMINRSLATELEDNCTLRKMKRVLSLSYNDLPFYLKSCFLYLSVFPEGHLIERARLIRLWIAEGFVEAKEGKTLEEVAENYLCQLLDRSLIQVAESISDGRAKAYHIHDLLREIIIKKSRDQNFAAIAKEDTIQLPEKIRRLSVHNTLPNLRQHRTSQIRSLLMFGVQDSLSKSSMPILFSGGLRLLTVLDLKSAPLKKFPDAVVKLFHLRYLSLRDTMVKKIPTAIQKLQNLETLDLKHTYVERLPAEILKLQRLRNLLVYQDNIISFATFGSKQGFKTPLKIGRLKSLQKLCFVKADHVDSGTMVSQLGKLNQLRRLGIIKLKKEDGKALCASIQKLSSLRALSLTSITEDEIIDLKYISSPPMFLQRLYLTGRLESFPGWISSLHSLVRVFLRWSRLQTDPLQSLEELPNLVHLELLQVCDGKTLRFNANKFQKLKRLSVDHFDELESMEVEEGSMPCLEKLIIQRCRLLQKIPSGIEGLTKLKVLEFFDMPDNLILTIRLDGEDHRKVAHIPEVYSNYWEKDRWKVSTLRRPIEAERSYQPSTEHNNK